MSKGEGEGQGHKGRRHLTLLLRLRRQDEDAAAGEFDRARARVDDLRQDASAARDAIDAHNRQARSVLRVETAEPSAAATAQVAAPLMPPSLAGLMLLEYRRRVADLQVVLADDLERLGQAEGEMELRRQALVAAISRRKAISRLVDRLSAHEARKVFRRLVKEQDDTHAAFQAASGSR